jgi:hypothetical protein
MDFSIRKREAPLATGKKPINLLKERGILHVGPSKSSTFEGQFNKPKVTDNTVEKENIIHVRSRLISIFNRSDEIKVP